MRIRLSKKGTRPQIIRGAVEAKVKARLKKFHSPEQVAHTLIVGSQGSPSTSTIYHFVRRDKDAGGSVHKALRIRGKRPYKLNNRPRKCLNWEIPQKFRELFLL